MHNENEQINDLVESWFGRHFHNVGAGLSEELYNRLYAAKDDLKVTLAGAVLPPAAPSA
jgi:hypothetical protein